jgi:TRAP transporter TAXI family solute receptor
MLVGGCTSDERRVDELIIATGGQGGVYYTLGNALADAARTRWDAQVQVLSTAAAVQNLELVLADKADLAFTTIDAATLAIEGRPPFAQPQPIAALAWIYDDYLQIVVRADGVIHAVADLRGARVSTGSAGSGTEIVAARVLDAAGISIDRDITRARLSAAESAKALQEGRIDGFFFTGGLPTPAVAELAAATRIRILSLTDEVAVLQQKYGGMYAFRTIASTVYGLDSPTATVAIPNVLVVRRDMAEETAHALTALLFDAKPQLVAAHAEARRLDQRAALGTFPVELHPGAARYYREAKTMAQ